MTSQHDLIPNKLPQVDYPLSSPETVKRLNTDDFDHISVKYDDCMLVLFYQEDQENIESYRLANVFGAAAQQIAGPIFATVNVTIENKIAETLAQLKSDDNNPSRWTAIREYPFIMAYQKGQPVSIYNGPLEVQALIDYSLEVVCKE